MGKKRNRYRKKSKSKATSVIKKPTLQMKNRLEGSISQHQNPSSSAVDLAKKALDDERKQRRQQFREDRKKQQDQFDREKQLLYKQQSSTLFSQLTTKCDSAPKPFQSKQEQLSYWFDEYSSEIIHKEWKPLTLEQLSELYQYAYHKCHKQV